MVDFINLYQLPLILLCFAIGSIGALLLFKFAHRSKAWEVADVIWVALGGLGAVVAIAVGIYQDDSTALNRQVTVAYTASRAFDADAARFRLRYCVGSKDADLIKLCEKVEYLSASSAGNTALPLFVSVTERTAPLEGFTLLFGRARERAAMEKAAAELEAAEFLAFDTRDVPTVMALEHLEPTRPEIAADYRVLALTYDALIAEIESLRRAWDVLQSGRALLILQSIAVCLVAFAAPFRLGRTIDGLV
ncbi:hypothetical protein [Shimia marina]|uniref:Uncharacterized protein n=1 Tax=Shimia marina TaxID=321267 RepID=A0A0P1ES45_9RHOB|nr:hypothetical protein [Shimia marina]CUH53337.1 hypothetical protein SHM7688_02791 [Shimia marina]SFD79456.1 hypothetical protein SAMN04488037_102480 [Shimia marina]